MKSLIVRRSFDVAGRKTSLSLESPFWMALQEIADKRHMTRTGLIRSIDAQRNHKRASRKIASPGELCESDA
jgi:predicted DNA-binding ribbon-helix-helix protein